VALRPEVGQPGPSHRAAGHGDYVSVEPVEVRFHAILFTDFRYSDRRDADG
jgi:hypothetical protein